MDWAVFAGAVLCTMLVNRLLFGGATHRISFREAALRSTVWVLAAAGFAGFILYRHGHRHAITFVVAYLVEQSLSVDNLFVFLVVFTYFSISEAHQARVLTWGVAGAVVMRAAFILAGTALLHHFHWMMYVFGGFLIYTALKLGLRKEEETINPEDNVALKLARRWLPATNTLDGHRFFTVENGKRVATPLMLVLIVIEFTDVMFAVDSVPAVLAISKNTFIVYTSNILAVLGLRSLYFLLAGMMSRFHYLDIGLACILGFVGVKMLAAEIVHIPNLVSLGVIALMLGIAITASLLRPKRPTPSTVDQ